MDAIIIQPPLVQLNTAYPSGAYLKSFFVRQGLNAKWFDLSIELFSEIFSSSGLKKLFDKTKNQALDKVQDFLKNGDEGSGNVLLRYVSESERWIEWIDTIVAILLDGNSLSGRELCHKFIFSPFAPRGNRMENFLENLGREPSTDDARFLASLALADLGDYITVVFDKEFSLVRYAEALTVNESSFSQIEKGIDSPILKNFYESVLQNLVEKEKSIFENPSSEKKLVCISVPFAGTFTAALYTARFLKNLYGDKIFITMGGGFVNTELRDVDDKNIFKYIDALSYDRGYGSYKKLLEENLNPKSEIYKLRFFDGEKIIFQKENDPELQKFEDETTSEIVPDFSDIDFSKYPRMIDDTNPMQRLWSDGAWMKAYLAHGCYWHRCDFCDVTLDYVYGYKKTKIENLYRGLENQAKEKGVWGIHFVDEALPPSAVTKFALMNAASENRFSFWGNVRFEKNFSYDLASVLSFGGLVGVSAGIEIATGTGLDNIHKGTDIDSIVGACCAFKENGILVHAYMIFGYWNQNDQDTINSMETLRQFYAAGLLDSSFWHKFVLTRHSRIYSEYKCGMHKNLKPIEPKNAGIFAKNGLHFEGEKKSEKFSNGLNAALQSWMHGEGLNKKVNKWFDFKTPETTIPKDYIESAIQKYEEKKNLDFAKPLEIKKLYWLGGDINLFDDNKKFVWLYMQDLCEEKNYLSPKDFEDFKIALKKLSPKNRDTNLMESLLQKNPKIEKTLKKLRGLGLAMV